MVNMSQMGRLYIRMSYMNSPKEVGMFIRNIKSGSCKYSGIIFESWFINCNLNN